MENHVLDVVTCGELLIDFVAIETGTTLGQASLFKKAPGGAPANVAVAVARLGHRAGFLGQVGEDEFGHFLAETLQHNGVDIAGLRFSSQARTALAFVSLLADGERDFMFYRHPSADMLWHSEQVDQADVARARIFHYGSISLIHEPSRSATLTALAYAKSNGALLSYDPNLRLPLWPSVDAARAGILNGWQHAEVIKVSEGELAFLSEQDTLEDTTGAGDGFVAGMLTGLLEGNLTWDKAVIEKALLLGNAVGALTTTGVGAISSLPTMAEVQSLLLAAQHR